MYTCRECEQPVNQATEVCPYCGADLTAAAPEEAWEPASKPRIRKVIVFWAAVLACVWAVAWFALPWRMAGSRTEAETRAQKALLDLHAALAEYQAAQGTFPETLEALGERGRAAAQAAQAVHYTLQYSPARPETDGRVRNYSLLARPGNYGYRNFFVDETGVVHATREDRPAAAQDPPI